MGGCWDFHNQLTWKQTFKSKKWWIPTSIELASRVFDNETTLYFSRHGHYHGDPTQPPCVESNSDFGPRPSRGEMYRNMLLTDVPVAGFGLLLTKVKTPWPIYAGMAGYGTVVHIRGSWSWYAHCN
jgi:hypothetical protein